MGSCISKCKPKKKLNEDSTHVKDKTVISQDAPIISPAEDTKIPLRKPLSPAPSTSSTASFSSLSYTSTAMASSISSSSSLSSSSSTSYSFTVSKDRSFSNDFLWSCAKENIPHLIGLKEENVVVEYSPLKKKQTVREKATVNAAATPKKRLRANSPPLVRQKSFRKEQNFVSSTPNRGLRSPSPSRRLNGESNRIFPVKESYYTKPVAAKRNNAVSSAPRRESFRAPSPNRASVMTRDYAVRKSEAFPPHICSKIDGKDVDVVMEDINNPLIALDCFIFL